MIETRFKKTEIGEIPEDWEVKKIGEIAPLQRGFDLPTSKLKNGTIPVVYSNGICNFHNKWICKAPGLVTGRSGTIGTFTFLPTGYYWPHNTALWVTSFNNNSPLFIYYLYSYLRFERFSGGSGVPTLNRNDVHEKKIIIPSLPEQQRIATALSDIDALLSTLTKKIEKKKLIKQGAIQQLLTGKKRLSGFTEPWEEKRLGTGLSFKPGFPFNSHNFSNTIGVRLIRNRDLKTDDQIIYYSGSYSHDYIINNGDLLIGMDGDFLPCLWSKGFALLNQRVGKIEIVNPEWNVTFLYYHLIGPLMKKQEGTGATTVKHLSHTDIESFILKLPPTLQEQSAIATLLSDMDKEIEALEAKRTKYTQVKQGMMQQLLTGRIRLVD